MGLSGGAGGGRGVEGGGGGPKGVVQPSLRSSYAAAAWGLGGLAQRRSLAAVALEPRRRTVDATPRARAPLGPLFFSVPPPPWPGTRPCSPRTSRARRRAHAAPPPCTRARGDEARAGRVWRAGTRIKDFAPARGFCFCLCLCFLLSFSSAKSDRVRGAADPGPNGSVIMPVEAAYTNGEYRR